MMDDTRTTVYFAGFELGSTQEEFRELFSQFGHIEKIFLHYSKNYGMVEFDNYKSCIEAIETLHQQPPLNMQLNMAKNQISNSGSSNSNGNSFASSTKRPQSYKKNYQSANKHLGESGFEENVEYDVQDYYMDENNEFVTVFIDPNTDEIYVPLRYAPNLRKISRKVPKKKSIYDDESGSVKSDNSERRVKPSKRNDSIPSIRVQKNLETDNSSYKRHNNFNQSFGTDNKKPFDKANSNNLFDKSQHMKRYGESDTSHRSYAQRNGENKNPNIQTSNRSPGSHNVGSKFSKDSVRPQKYFEAPKRNEEDWGSPGSSTQSKVEKPAPQSAQCSSVKVETVAPVPVSSKVDVSETVEASADATKPNKKFVLDTVELPENQFTEVHVENVVNETVGWVSLTNKMTEFENLTLNICCVIEDAPTCVPEVGKLALGLYEGLWFRAIILTTSPDIRVRYIDYGNEEVVPKSDLKELPPAFAKIPAFALCIKLASGAPCKMVNDITIKVKPVHKENNLTVVHVENGIYEIKMEKSPEPAETVITKSTKPVKIDTPKVDDHLLNTFHELLISQIKVQDSGFLELNISLSKTKFIASFMPLNLTEEAAKLQNKNPSTNPSFKPVVGEIVCAENEDGWQRVYLLKIESNMYKVAFIDFGDIKDVAEIRCLPIEFINIPIFSCVCSSKNGDDLTQINEAVDFVITNITGNNISCAINFNKKQIDVTCVPWDPRTCLPELDATPQINTNAPLPEIELKNGEDVKLEMESDGFLYVRNKQASEVRKKIDKFMAVNGSQAAAISGKPHVGQLVTAEFEGGFYRAIIKSIENNMVSICYIDYGNEENLPYFSLKVIHKEIVNEPISIIKIRLRNFINKPFTAKALQYLENLSVKNVILKATFDESPENGYDLKTSNGLSISDELEKLEQIRLETKPQKIQKQPVEEQNEFYKTIKIPSDNETKILMYDLPLQEIPLGKTEVVFQQFSHIDNNILCVCVNNPEVLHKVHVELQNQIAKYVNHSVPNVSYEPKMEECVLVQSEGKWYRGACTSEPENNEYTIFLVDYGSCTQFSPKNMRRMPKEFAKDNALCNFAKINGIPDNAKQALRNRLKELLERNNSYSVNVLEKIEEDECYIIQFPTIMEVLKEEKLI